ncbi:hypothetical protein [Rhodobacteraceae bacterium DSL-40]|uniref:hypothetical protein n=1 Tax=Amaricoccus sp. B4 TaxID=3368557 RepID=UPI0013A69B27
MVTHSFPCEDELQLKIGDRVAFNAFGSLVKAVSGMESVGCIPVGSEIDRDAGKVRIPVAAIRFMGSNR